jgi:chemotaxis protein MotB
VAKAQQRIIVKKLKGRGHKAHGGAWKVAYADFVTAMMAFFLLLWLLNAVSQEQLKGISDYFSPITTRKATTGGGGLLAGKTLSEKGVFDSEVAPERITSQPPPLDTPGHPQPPPPPSEAEQPADLAAREEKQFRQAEKALRAAMERLPEFRQLANSLLIENTPEGLRIQIIDQKGLPMFPRGSAVMYTQTRAILDVIAQVVREMPQKIAISGHTDAIPYQSSAYYSNWELSADRANAARRVLVEDGLTEGRIARVVGKAANEPLLPEDPEAPGNRRLAVVLLREAGIKR